MAVYGDSDAPEPTFPPALLACLQLIITHITARNAHVRQLLAAQGLILRQPVAHADAQPDSGPTCFWFPTMDAGCHYCEERFLEVAVSHGLLAPPARHLSLAQVKEEEVP